MVVKKLLAGIISGVLLSLPWHGLSGLFLLIAFIPLLWAQKVHFDEGQKLIRFLPIAFTTFLTWNLLSTWWIGAVSIIGGTLVIVLNSLVMLLAWAIPLKLNHEKGPYSFHFFLVVGWLSFEFAHYHWELSWPWLNLGNGFANDIKLIQWYEYTGVLGGTLWVLLFNLLLYEALLVNRHRVQIGLIVSLLLLPIPISFMLFERDEANTGTLNIAVLQPNIDPFSQKFSNLSPEEQYSILFRLADSLNTGQTDIFLGPETALHHVDEAAVEKEHSIQLFKDYLEEHAQNASFIIGGNGFRNDGRTKNTSIQTHRGIKEIHKPEKYNSAYFISAWKNTEIYHKTKLVSGVEKMPFSKIFPGIDHLIMNLGGNTGSLSVSSKNIVFHTTYSTIGVPICYESCYGEYLGKMAQEGARSFFIITNDGWWKGTTGYKQHLAWSRIRAIEHRRSVVRSANTGISAAIDHRGQYLEKTQWWSETGFTVNVPLYERSTFYTKHGDYIGRIAVLVFLATVIAMIFYWKRIA